VTKSDVLHMIKIRYFVLGVNVINITFLFHEDVMLLHSTKIKFSAKYTVKKKETNIPLLFFKMQILRFTR
jgi:hypothetical protein